MPLLGSHYFRFSTTHTNFGPVLSSSSGCRRTLKRSEFGSFYSSPNIGTSKTTNGVCPFVCYTRWGTLTNLRPILNSTKVLPHICVIVKLTVFNSILGPMLYQRSLQYFALLFLILQLAVFYSKTANIKGFGPYSAIVKVAELPKNFGINSITVTLRISWPTFSHSSGWCIPFQLGSIGLTPLGN